MEFRASRILDDDLRRYSVLQHEKGNFSCCYKACRVLHSTEYLARHGEPPGIPCGRFGAEYVFWQAQANASVVALQERVSCMSQPYQLASWLETGRAGRLGSSCFAFRWAKLRERERERIRKLPANKMGTIMPWCGTRRTTKGTRCFGTWVVLSFSTEYRVQSTISRYTPSSIVCPPSLSTASNSTFPECNVFPSTVLSEMWEIQNTCHFQRHLAYILDSTKYHEAIGCCAANASGGASGEYCG